MKRLNSSALSCLLASLMVIASPASADVVIDIPDFVSVEGQMPRAISVTGNVDYKVIGNTMSNSDRASNCRAIARTTAALNLPSDAIVHAAFLNWAGSGYTPDTNVTLNGIAIESGVTQTSLPGYWSAVANVTPFVRTSGNYSVSDFRWLNNAAFCNNTQAHGVWSLTVVYESQAAARGTVDVYGGVMVPNRPGPGGTGEATMVLSGASTCGRKVKMTNVWADADRNMSENFWINGFLMGSNILGDNTVHNLDIDTWYFPLAPGQDRLRWAGRADPVNTAARFDRTYNTLTAIKSPDCNDY